jgi:predicted AAA+ superfamily ATPase
MFYRRTLLDALQSQVSRNKVRLLFGARQTGKTELFNRVVSGDSAVFYRLDEPGLRRRFERDPGSLGRELRALGRHVRFVVIDEIQKVPGLLDEVQAVYDSARTRFQFFLTGSSARTLRRQSANLLPGRSHVFHLHPVCAWESQGRPRADWPGAESGRAIQAGRREPPLFPPQSLERTLVLGNLPGIRQEPPDTAAATLAAYVDNYLEEDVRREALARDLGAFSSFVTLAALESGGQVNLTKLSQESGVPASTLRNFYDVLVETFVGFWLRPYTDRARKRLLTTPRFYLFDTGVRNAASGLSLDLGLRDSDAPRLLEHFVATELFSRASYRGRGCGVTFWRTVSGAEVDFVWQDRVEDIPIEVKWTARPRPEDARHVELFLNTYAPRARRGLLVCRCERPQMLTERVMAVPWDAW